MELEVQEKWIALQEMGFDLREMGFDLREMSYDFAEIFKQNRIKLYYSLTLRKLKNF